MVRLASISQNQSSITNFYSTDEIIGLLIKYGLFDDALIATKLFKATPLPMLPVFVGLVDRCCADQDSKDTFQNEFDFAKNNDSIESYSPYENPSDFKWRLLISYLTKFNNTEYYKVVSKRILKNGYEIPSSITYIFKQLDLNALVKIYIEFSFWEECVEIISERIDFIINKESRMDADLNGGEFNKKAVKLSTMSFNNIDKILYVLSKSKDIALTEKGTDLKKKLDEYLCQIQFESESIVKQHQQVY